MHLLGGFELLNVNLTLRGSKALRVICIYSPLVNKTLSIKMIVVYSFAFNDDNLCPSGENYTFRLNYPTLIGKRFSLYTSVQPNYPKLSKGK